MNFHAETSKLKSLVTSYFRGDLKRFCHCGDCRIYSANRPLCDCGLIYRLGHIDHTLAAIIYPEFDMELYIQETGKKKYPKYNKKKMAEAMELLEKIFGKIEKPSLEALKMDYDEMYKIIDAVFSPKMFPAAYRRLKKWLADEVRKP